MRDETKVVVGKVVRAVEFWICFAGRADTIC